MTVAILAIDPGTTRSAWVLLTPGSATIDAFDIEDNDAVLEYIRADPLGPFGIVVIEKVEGLGMPAGVELFETVFWSGRFAEAAHPLPVVRIGRKAVKVHLCGSTRAKDPNVRQAVIDRYGGSDSIRKGGALYRVSSHVWAALAVGLTHIDQAAAL